MQKQNLYILYLEIKQQKKRNYGKKIEKLQKYSYCCCWLYRVSVSFFSQKPYFSLRAMTIIYLQWESLLFPHSISNIIKFHIFCSFFFVFITCKCVVGIMSKCLFYLPLLHHSAFVILCSRKFFLSEQKKKIYCIRIAQKIYSAHIF